MVDFAETVSQHIDRLNHKASIRLDAAGTKFRIQNALDFVENRLVRIIVDYFRSVILKDVIQCAYRNATGYDLRAIATFKRKRVRFYVDSTRNELQRNNAHGSTLSQDWPPAKTTPATPLSRDRETSHA
jgi:hypothetical protein